MTQRHQRSRTLRRVFVKLADKVRLTYKKRKPSKQICGNCKKQLSGVLRERPHKMRTIAKSKKTPSRKFGGNLCSKCAREELKKRARS